MAAQFKRAFEAFEHTPPLIVIDPLAARLFAERGFRTKVDLIAWCAHNARMPARDYWDQQWIQTLERPRAVAGIEPFASRLRAAPEEMIEIFEPSDINIVVTGGETQGAWRMFGSRYEKAVSVDAWR